MGNLRCGDGSSLDEELIDTNETADVTARNIFDGLGVTTHHENRALNALQVQIVLLSMHVVGTHDADLLTSSYCTGEDTTESIETSFVRGGNHL